MRLARDRVIVLHSNGMSQAEIARNAGVSRQRINQVVEESRRDALRQRCQQLHQIFERNREVFRLSRQAFLESLEAFNHAREVRLEYLKAHPRARLEHGPVNSGATQHSPTTLDPLDIEDFRDPVSRLRREGTG